MLGQRGLDRKSTRLNSSHGSISYAVFCLKTKKRADRHRGRDPRRGARKALERPYAAARAADPTHRPAFPAPRALGDEENVCFFHDPATTEIYTLSLHDALPIARPRRRDRPHQPANRAIPAPAPRPAPRVV